METIQNKYGNDRVIEKVSSTRLRVMGESLVSRNSCDDKGNTTMFDFEGGPCLTVGGKLKFGNYDWVIVKINPEKTEYENFSSVTVDVKL